MRGNPFGTFGTGHAELLAADHGGYVPSRLTGSKPEGAFLTETRAAFRDFVMRQEFPCVGARAAFNSKSYALVVYDELAGGPSTTELCHDLYEFTRSALRKESEYATFVAVFRGPEIIDETQFESAMWRQLQLLNNADAKHFGWAPAVRSDPADPLFSYSFAGQSLYVIGLHATSSREARRFRWPTLVFNPHEQFERLRAEGKWKRMQQTIRERDRQLQGSINPMLSDFGESTEARQYSGRAVEENWRAPFVAEKSVAKAKCPFAH